MSNPKNYSIRTLSDHIGHDFGSSEPIRVDQIKINIFADVTGDHQWIHVDVAKAKKRSPFGGPVAHGYLTLSLLAGAVDSAGVVPSDAQGVINYGIEKLRFLAPVPAGAEIIASFKLVDVTEKAEKQQLMRIEAIASIVGEDKPAIVAELLAVVIG